MEKLSTQNNKKCIIISKENLLIDGIVKKLTEIGYNSTIKSQENLKEIDFKTRLAVIVSKKISERELTLVETILKKSLYAKTILVLGETDNTCKMPLEKIGLDGAVSAFDTPEIFKNAIEAVERDEKYFADSLSKKTYIIEDNLNSLTKRQYQIYVLKKENKSNNEIAKALGVTPKTISNHLTKINKILAEEN